MSAVDKLLKIAEAEVGYLEKKSNSNLASKTANAGSNNYTKYANDFDKVYTSFYNGKKNGAAWCDMFVDWCFVKAFGEALALKLLGQPKKSCGAGCKFSADYFKKIKRFYTSPKVGDQIFFKNSSGTPCHTGLVYKVDSTYVYTIEGNTSSASGVIANGGTVAKKKYKRNYALIYGYGRPDFSLAESKATSSVAVAKPATTTTATEKKAYFERCADKSNSIVDALKSIGADSSFSYRKKIAKANGISGYIGTPTQNTKLLIKLKAGTLIKP